MHLAPFQIDAVMDQCAGMVACYRVAQCRGQGSLTALVRPLQTLLHGHIEFVGQKTGEIGRGKGFQFLIVVGLDGVHVIVRHFTGGIRRYFLKREKSGPVDVIVFRFRDLIVTGAVCMGACGFVTGIALRLAVKHPEGDIDPLDLLHMVLLGKAFG